MLSPQGVRPQPFEVSDFSGGITDNYVAAAPNKYEEADNFYVGDDKKLITRAALVVDDETYPRVPSNNRIQALFDSESQLFQLSNGNIYYNSSGFTTVSGPTSNKAMNNGDTTAFYSWTSWNKHIFLADSKYSNVMKLFKDGSTWKAHQLGLPALGSTPTITGTGAGNTYLYAFHYYYTYTASGVTFEEAGPVTYSNAVSNNNTPDVTNIAHTAIPVLANGGTGNYDTTNIKVKIFRTKNNGQTYYKVGEVTNGTTTFTDNVADTNLELEDELYTTGDIPEHEAPPAAKFVHSVNDVLILGAVKEGGVEYKNKVRYSNRFQPWSCPSEFYEEFDEEITGLSSVNVYPIVFCKNKVYRVEGYYLPDGSGVIRKKLISDKAGCVSARSIVQTEQGVFWAGNGGFYFTDGNSVIRISDFPNTYANFTSVDNQKNRIYAAYDPLKQQVLWTMQEDTSGSDNDCIFVCHLKFGVSPEMCFTTWSGGSVYASNFAPTSIYFYNNTLYHGDTRGYLLKYDDDTFSDIKIDTGVSAANWIDTTIMYTYKSPAFDFGSHSIRKWIPWITVNADNASSVSLLISINNDNSGYYRELAEFSYRGTIAWGDYEIEWGDNDIRWDYAPIISGKRRAPAGGLRALYAQVRFTNSYTEIENSTDLASTATFDGSANTVTLNAAVTWPEDVLDYYISSASDSYETQYRITARTSDTVLTVEDTGGTLPSSSLAWKLQGYKRDEILRVISYSINYSLTSQSLEPYQGSA